MDFFLNELSLHNQFESIDQFLSSLNNILKCKNIIDKSGFRLYCEKTIANRPVYHNNHFDTVIQKHQDHNLTRKIRLWLVKDGPFWDNPPEHNPDDIFEYAREPLLDYTSLAEAAFQIATQQSKCGMVSFNPSDFQLTPLLVYWHKTTPPLEIAVPNYWEHSSLENSIKQLQPPPTSWRELLQRAQNNFPHLIFLDNVVNILTSETFNTTIANRIIFQLEILDRLASCFDNLGHRTQAGHEIIDEYFTGDNAIFSDESLTNKNHFHKELTFLKSNGDEIFCPYHGKIRHRVFRLHFSWPIRYQEPVYIAYIGPKITKY